MYDDTTPRWYGCLLFFVGAPLWLGGFKLLSMLRKTELFHTGIFHTASTIVLVFWVFIGLLVAYAALDILLRLDGRSPCYYDEYGDRWCREPGPPLPVKHMMSRGDWPPR